MMFFLEKCLLFMKIYLSILNYWIVIIFTEHRTEVYSKGFFEFNKHKNIEMLYFLIKSTIFLLNNFVHFVS